MFGGREAPLPYKNKIKTRRTIMAEIITVQVTQEAHEMLKEIKEKTGINHTRQVEDAIKDYYKKMTEEK